MRCRGPAAIVNDRRILSSERMLHKEYDRKYSVEKKTLLVVTLKGFVAYRKLIGGKPPVVN
jgi:hypothetical protein